MRWPWARRHDLLKVEADRAGELVERADRVMRKAIATAGKAASNAERAAAIREQNGWGALLLESYELKEPKPRRGGWPWKRS